MTTYIQLTGASNPLNGVDVGSFSVPVAADVNGDGNLDIVIGEQQGKLKLYLNIGSVASPIYSEQTGAANPFDAIDVGFSSVPTFADIDNDGDLDAIIGERNGTLKHYLNTGTSTAPTYIEQTGAANPLNGISAGTFSAPDFVDLDSDGDLDVVVGNFAGNLSYYQNTGTSANPVYAQQTGAANPFNGIDVGSRANSAFVDVDFDGDLDAVVGGADGKLKYYKNTGSSLNPVYSQQTGVNNPFDNVLVAQGSAPMFVDGDGDSDLDLVIGDSTGTLSYYQNTAPVVDTLVSQTAGSVTITDFNGGDSDDNLTLTESAGTIIISDLIETFQVAGAATLVDSHTVSVVAASVTSPIVINLAGGVNTVIATTVTKDLMINGGSGYSTIKSGSGNDTINGGTGKSKIEGGAGADNLDGGSNDDDTVEYTSSAAGVRDSQENNIPIRWEQEQW
jgi:hypothetical protein